MSGWRFWYNKWIGHEQNCRSCRWAPIHVTLQSRCSASEKLLGIFLAGGVPPEGMSPEGRFLGGEAAGAFERLM